MPSAETAHGFRAFSATVLEEAGLRLRSALPDDGGLLARIYASARDEELRQVPWSAEEKMQFTDWQSALQEEHYALHYPRAERLVVARIELAGETTGVEPDIGRLYVESAGVEVRLMEMTLLPAYRNRGVGTRLLQELLRYADALGKPCTLHVEPFNPAKRMYDRLGFVACEKRGVYEFMVRSSRCQATVPDTAS